MTFEDFCGPGPIWDANVTWNTDNPDFTPCFLKSVMSWIPGFVLLILAPFEAISYQGSKNRYDFEK